MTDKLLKELKKLDLPTKSYAIFGSGPMGIRGMIESHDFDILVTPELFKKMAEKYPVKKAKSGDDLIEIGDLEFFPTWTFTKKYLPSTAELISTAEIIKGIPFVKLEHVRTWKEHMGRPKDLEDIKLMDEFLKKDKKATIYSVAEIIRYTAHKAYVGKPQSTIEIECSDMDGSLIRLLAYIMRTGNLGHSFDIVVDPDMKEHKMNFGWDGDGADSIRGIKLNGKKVNFKDYFEKDKEKSERYKKRSS